jgi:hypothetical protein
MTGFPCLNRKRAQRGCPAGRSGEVSVCGRRSTQYKLMRKCSAEELKKSVLNIHKIVEIFRLLDNIGPRRLALSNFRIKIIFHYAAKSTISINNNYNFH